MNKKDLLLSICIVGILAMPFVAMSAQFFMKPEPTATAVATAALAEACTHWSPDGRYCAGKLDFQGAIVQTEDGRTLFSPWVKWTTFQGWTADGRYALFDHTDQYGNRRGVLFDVENWTVSQPGGDCAYPGRMSASCRFGFELVDLENRKVLQGSGTLYDLQTGSHINLFPDPQKAIVVLASLSPDNTKLALFGAPEMSNGYPLATAVTLYIANIDGTGLTAVPELSFSADEPGPTTMAWSEDGQTILFRLSDGLVYQYNLHNGQLEHLTAVDDSP